MLGVACGGVGLFFDVSAVWQRVSDPRGVRSVKFLSSLPQTKETNYFIGWDQHSPVPGPPPSPWKRKTPPVGANDAGLVVMRERDGDCSYDGLGVIILVVSFALQLSPTVNY